jgi:hypothetical protein
VFPSEEKDGSSPSPSRNWDIGAVEMGSRLLGLSLSPYPYLMSQIAALPQERVPSSVRLGVARVLVVT